ATRCITVITIIKLNLIALKVQRNAALFLLEKLNYITIA
ncbi:MAG: hypothetical protein K0Q97_3084, partial [Bacillota bacterium]|nr:hypothetical protein [Bacillota bacterium]